MPLGERLLQPTQDALHLYHRHHLEEAAEDDHVERLLHVQLRSRVHRIDAIDVDIGACGGALYPVAVVDQDAARLHLRLKLVQRGLIEHDGYVVRVQDRRADPLVIQNHGHVGRAAALLRAVGGHPSDLLVFHQPRVSQNLTHREHSLSAESGDDNLMLHGCIFFIG